MSKKNEEELEQKLINKSSLDELIKQKMEEELKAEIEKAKIKPEKQLLTDISKVPQDLIFSKYSVFRVFNRVNKTESFINGIQAESMMGLQTSTREQFKLGLKDAFSTDEIYVKFEKIEH